MEEEKAAVLAILRNARDKIQYGDYETAVGRDLSFIAATLLGAAVDVAERIDEGSPE